jgi:chemotaxis protein methyltransferase CheR
LISIQQQEFTKLTDYLKQNFGINLTKKKNLIEGRLSNYLSENGYVSFEAYINAVFSDPTGREMVNLINRLTTNHTYFMREWKSLEYYRDSILPPLSRRLTDHDLRVWSAGCSSGEEPYMLSMIHRDFFGPSCALWDTTVLATDISLSVLNKARAGNYQVDALQVLPKPWLMRYFKPMPDNTYT